MTDTSPPGGRLLLEVDDLVVGFRRRRFLGRSTSVDAVKGVSLSIAPGETLGVVGQSGSGKSTLARTIVGLERATSGTIRVNGRLQDGSPSATAELRSNVQMIFQDSINSLNPHRTIGSTLAEPLIVHSIVPRAGLKSRIIGILDTVGLPSSYIDRHPMQLSGGQRQRVNIARALASEPKLIIADEPTSALDVSIRSQILELMKSLQRDRDFSYLFISHDLHVVRYMSDYVMVMNDGVVVESADRQSIYARPAHEYTRALLAASPTTTSALAKARAARAGES